MVKLADSMYSFYLGELIFHNIYSRFSKEIQLCAVWLTGAAQQALAVVSHTCLVNADSVYSEQRLQPMLSALLSLAAEASLHMCSSNAFGLFMFSPFLSW